MSNIESRIESDQAQRFLAQATEHVLRHGLRDWSLRAMAQTLNTSHRMLSYYFGNADQFWILVLQQVRRHEQTKPDPFDCPSDDPVDKVAAGWAHYSAPEHLPVMRLMFEVFGRAVHDREVHADFLRAVIESWVPSLQQDFERVYGLSAAEANALGRLCVGTTRGLMFDLLAVEDQAGVDAAFQAFLLMLRRALPPIGPA